MIIFARKSLKMQESKESIFFSRLYLVYYQTYIIFFNTNFNLKNKGFIINIKRRKLKRSLAETNVPERCNNTKDIEITAESLIYNICKGRNNSKDYYKVYIIIILYMIMVKVFLNVLIILLKK